MGKIRFSAIVATLLAVASLPAYAGGGHSHTRVGVYIGAPVVIGGWWGAPRPYYYPAYYPSYYPYYYTPAPVVVREVVREPLVYYDERGNPVPPAQPQNQAQGPQPSAAAPTWFFCADSQTYYPYAQTCASPWQRVAPLPPPQ
jgi:hypothetical protein